MRAIFWREFRELLLPAIPFAGFAVLYAGELLTAYRVYEELLLLVFLGGAAVGLLQGLLDRLRERDAFLLHRPIPRAAIHAARTLAGFAAVALPVLLGMASLKLWPPPAWHGNPAFRPSWGEPPLHRPDALMVSISLLVALASFALVRFAVAIPRIVPAMAATFLLPLAAGALLSRIEGTLGAQAGLAAVALLATLGSMMRLAPASFPRALRAGALLAAILLVGIEATAWLRVAGTRMQLAAFPKAGLTLDGEMRLVEERRSSRGEEVRFRRVVWDEHRVELAAEGFDGPGAEAPHGPTPLPVRPFLPDEAIRIFGFLDDAVAGFEPRRQPRRAPADVASLLGSGQGGGDGGWSYEEGFFLFRPVFGGPPKWRVGREDGLPFREPRLLGSFHGTQAVSVSLLDGGTLTTIRVPRSGEPKCRTLPLEPPVRLLPTPWSWRWPDEDRFVETGVIASGDRLMVVDEVGGISASSPLGADEAEYLAAWDSRVTAFQGKRRDELAQVHVATTLGPCHPLESRLRLRRFVRGEETTRKDLRLTPHRPLEKTVAALQGLVALLRPPLANAASAFARGPRTPHEMSDAWLLDPLFSEGRCPGWLAASVATGLACGWFALRRGRVRCRDASNARLWGFACLLLGPIGLLWMRTTLGGHHVERVGAGRRAVNLDSCPETAAPWPAPEPKGTEVFA